MRFYPLFVPSRGPAEASVMVLSLGCVWSSQPEPTSIRTMTACPQVPLWTPCGIGFSRPCPPVGSRASIRATLPPRLLHHAPGRQLGGLGGEQVNDGLVVHDLVVRRQCIVAVVGVIIAEPGVGVSPVDVRMDIGAVVKLNVLRGPCAGAVVVVPDQ